MSELEYYTSWVGLLELFAAAMIVTNVYLLGKERLSNYYFGLAGVLAYTVVFYQVALYADAQLQLFFYVPMTVVGYVAWRWGGLWDGLDTLPIRSTPWRVWATLVPLGLVLYIPWAGYLANDTDAAFPYLDTAIAVLSILATGLMTWKYIESWYLWITVDLIAVPLYWVKGLHVTSVLYFWLLVLCIIGLTKWRKNYGHKSV